MENSNIFLKNFIIAIVIVVFALFIINVFNISYPLTVITTTKSTELSVVGEGKVEVVPDTAYMTAGITIDNKSTVKEVSNELNKINNKIINELKNLGIDKKNIKTSNYSIYPNYKYDNSINSINGYNGNTTIEIKIKDVNKTSEIMEIVTTSGANTIHGIRFSIDQPEKYREQARNKAIENAKDQAQKIAKNLGIKLGKVVNIVESAGNQPIPFYKTMTEGMGSAGGGGPNIEEGTQIITSVITLYFEKN